VSRYGVGRDKRAWFVTRDDARVRGIGVFRHKADAEHVAARRNEGKRTYGTLPSLTYSRE
jgi:hypothetical protein